MNTVTPKEFADAMSITERAAQKAFAKCADGGTWRGHILPVCKAIHQRGGAAGGQWCLHLDALPAELRIKFEGDLNALQISGQTAFDEALTDQAKALASWRWSIISGPYGLPTGPIRAAEVDRIAAAVHHFQGRDVTVSRTTIYDWISRYKAGGFGALATTARADRGRPRVTVSRKWDAQIDLSDAAKARVSEQLEAYAKRFMRSDGSARKLAAIGARKLAELCVQEGSKIDAPDLAVLCKLNQKWTARFAEFKRVARKDRDAKLHFDHDQPRIARHGPDLPGQVVFGDVHPGDLLVMDENGEQIRVRLIAWQDACTHMLHVTPVLFRKGRGVRQSDIVDSFWDFTSNPHFGLPGTLYLDNGGEYGSLYGAFKRFPDLSQIVPGRGVIKAKPYNGPAKGLIEGAFASIERQFMKHLPGYIGGDRTNKKTQSVGKPPAPYAGTYGQLLEQLEEVAAMYNDTSQSGLLKGLSPRQALAKAVKFGWAASTMDVESFDLVFSEQKTPMVSQGAFRCNGQRYYSDEIAKLGHGDYLDVRVPLRTSTVECRPELGQAGNAGTQHQQRRNLWLDGPVSAVA